MKEQRLALINNAMAVLVIALAFLLPVFFLPVTTEFFEFNKLALTALVAMLLALLWAVKMLVEGKVEITKSPTNMPILLLLVVYGISTYFSRSTVSSILGSYGRWSSSLFLIVIVTVLYFAITSNLRSKRVIAKTMAAFVAGATLSSVVASLSYLGVKFGTFQFAQIRNFTLTGSSVTATAVAALAVVISISLLVDVRDPKKKLLFTVLGIVNILCVALLGISQSWILLAVGVVAFMTLTPADRVRTASKNMAVLAGVLVISGVLLSVPFFKNALRINVDYPREIKLDLKSSWNVATSALRDFPIVGAGPSTFYLNFTSYRPLSLNSTDQWAVSFDKPFNEYLDILSSLGLIGFFVYALFVYKAVVLARQTNGSGVNAGLSAAVIAVLVFFAFYYSTVLTTVLLFLLLALLTSYSEGNFSHSLVGGMVEAAIISFSVSGKSTNVTTKTVSVMFAVPMFLLVALGAYMGYRVYGAEVAIRTGLAAAQNNNASGLYTAQRRAIALNPYIDSYHASFAQTNFLLANSLAGSKKTEELTDEDKRNIQNLIAAAIQETRITTEVLNRTNAANWTQRGRLYSLLTNVAKDADTWAVGSYTRAIELDPTNPVLRINLGGIYFGKKDFANAERHFRAAVSLKPNYANGYYNLAQALKEQKRYQEALTAMQIVTRLVPKDSEDFKRADAELTALKDLPAVAGAQTSQPSVNELTTGGAKNQQPLTNPAEKPLPSIKESTSSLTPNR